MTAQPIIEAQALTKRFVKRLDLAGQIDSIAIRQCQIDESDVVGVVVKGHQRFGHRAGHRGLETVQTEPVGEGRGQPALVINDYGRKA